MGGDGLPTPGFGGREAWFGLILAHISKFDFSGFSALLQQRATDPTTLYLGPHLGPRFQTTTAAANNRLLTSRNLPGPIPTTWSAGAHRGHCRFRRHGSRSASPAAGATNLPIAA
jgi:hypothetical protein